MSIKATLSGWFSPGEDWREKFAFHAARAPAGPLREFYQHELPRADCPLGDVPMVSIDLETTGLDPDRHGIVSIGTIAMNLARIDCRAARHWIIKPESALSSESVTIHAITHSEVNGSPALESLFQDVLDVLAGRVAVAHFAPIERRFLEEAAVATYGYPLHFPIIDTMELERRYYKTGLRGLFSRVGSLRLDACRSRLNLPRYKAHHALTDALATAELLQAQVAYRYRAADPVSWFWV